MQNQSLEFMLMSNHLKNDGRFIPRIINQKAINFDNLLDEMEDNTTQRKEDIRLALSHFQDSLIKNLGKGLKVSVVFGIVVF